MIFVFGLDEGFVMPTGIALVSLDRFLSRSDRIVLLYDGVSTQSAAALRSCVSNAATQEIDCSRRIDESWTPAPHLTRATYLRFLAPELLEGDGRAVYLDGDVLVRQDPRPLHDHDLGGNTLGAVRSRVTPFVASPGGITNWVDLGLRGADPFFNAGVYVVDLVRWRNKDVTAVVTEYLIGQAAHLQIGDQEALNVAVASDWTMVDRTWNYITHVTESFLQDPDAEPDEPCVVHFAGPVKPWTYGRQPLFAEEWHELRADSPWASFERRPSPLSKAPRARARRAVARGLREVRELLREAPADTGR